MEQVALESKLLELTEPVRILQAVDGWELVVIQVQLYVGSSAIWLPFSICWSFSNTIQKYIQNHFDQLFYFDCCSDLKQTWEALAAAVDNHYHRRLCLRCRRIAGKTYLEEDNQRMPVLYRDTLNLMFWYLLSSDGRDDKPGQESWRSLKVQLISGIPLSKHNGHLNQHHTENAIMSQLPPPRRLVAQINATTLSGKAFPFQS
jgi:hypothetical protein